MRPRDPTVLNKHSVYNMSDMGLSIFAVLCGKNRGAFVLQNYTYSCLELPDSFAVNAGIDLTDKNWTIGSTNDISELRVENKTLGVWSEYLHLMVRNARRLHSSHFSRIPLSNLSIYCLQRKSSWTATSQDRRL